MSTYAYKCNDCGNAFDVNASIQEKEEGKDKKFACSKCQSENTKQVFSAGHFIKNIVKGEGKEEGSCSGGSCGTHNEEKEDSCCGTDDKSKEKEGGCCGGGCC